MSNESEMMWPHDMRFTLHNYEQNIICIAMLLDLIGLLDETRSKKTGIGIIF